MNSWFILADASVAKTSDQTNNTKDSFNSFCASLQLIILVHI